jgi:hypothetical protein
MIDRKQAALLLSQASRQYSGVLSDTLLESVYSAADETASRILKEHPDLRPKLRAYHDLEIRLATERREMRDAIAKVQEALCPSEDKPKSSDRNEDEAADESA